MTESRSTPEEHSAVAYSLSPPLRMHHLNGGASLLAGANRMAVLLPTLDPEIRVFSLLPGAKILSLFDEQEGIRFLGRTRYSSADEMHEPISPNFIISAVSGGSHCLARTQFDHWCGVENTLRIAAEESHALAARLTTQIRLCLHRLERLSMAYRTTLSVVGQRTEPEHFTGDKYAQHIGSEYRSLLNELYSLRDAVLGVAYSLCYGCTDGFEIKKLRRLVEADNAPSAKLIVQSMFDPKGDLLIDHMSLQRNIAQHSLGKTNRLFGDVYRLKISSGPFGEIPYLVFPLYDDFDAMRQIERSSSKGKFEPLSLEEAKDFLRRSHHLDALEFCFACFERLLRICECLAAEIGIKPQRHTITDADILKGSVTDEFGNTHHFKGREPDPN